MLSVSDDDSEFFEVAEVYDDLNSLKRGVLSADSIFQKYVPEYSLK